MALLVMLQEFNVHILGQGAGSWIVPTKQEAVRLVDRRILQGVVTDAKGIHNGLVVYEFTKLKDMVTTEQIC